MLLLSRSEEIILAAIWKLKIEAYGVTIREQIYNDIGHYWSFGVIYKTLKKMVRKEYVRRFETDPSSERGGRAKYVYELTEEGVTCLAEIQKINADVWAGITDLTYAKK